MFDYNGLTIGFHGCDETIAKDVVLGHADLKPSNNKYDWLGGGVYFWENDPVRAMEFAKERGFPKPCVVGAVLNLGYCLDLSTRSGLERIKLVWENIVKPTYDNGNIQSNKAGKKIGENGELMLRFLDCHVIEALHKYNEDNHYEEFDSVRAPFWEGTEIYPTAGFFTKTHIQLCVRNTDCILGYFLPKNIMIP